jgi:sugar/nucleoside kinase (ribokinase family)
MTPPPSVVCAGILVADLFVPPLARLPVAGELLATGDFLMQPGGCAANTALSLARLGVQANVVGKVGQDHFGDFIAQSLRAKGVATDAITRSTSHPTSQTVILPVIGEDRRYIHTIGANADLAVSDIDPSLLFQARVFALGGYLVLPKMEQSQVAALFATLHAKGVQTVLDIVVPANGELPKLDAVRQILPYVDVFMPNDHEAELLTGEADAHKQAEIFLQAGCQVAIITKGSRGALLMSANETHEMPAVALPFVDGSGAGDAFAAGFIVGLLEQWPLAQALRFASVIGASACTQLGCTDGIFTRAEAEAFLQAHPSGA